MGQQLPVGKYKCVGEMWRARCVSRYCIKNVGVTYIFGGSLLCVESSAYD
jgi:hypothetical protein